MATTCKKCGEKIGFFKKSKNDKELCKKCADLIQNNIGIYESALQELIDNIPFTEQSEHQLISLKQKLELTDAEIAHTIADIDHAKSLARLYAQPLPVEKSCEIILKKNEVCHFSSSTDLIEERRKSHYVGGTQGVSVRIAKGLSYRVGGFKGERVTEDYNEITDTGMLYITNKRIVFAGKKKNISYTLTSIASINRFTNAIQFKKENEAKPKYFGTNDHQIIDKLYVIVSRLLNSRV
jgi:hypothetical protein